MMTYCITAQLSGYTRRLLDSDLLLQRGMLEANMLLWGADLALGLSRRTDN
jgi:hypothetical protein